MLLLLRLSATPQYRPTEGLSNPPLDRSAAKRRFISVGRARCARARSAASR